MSYKTFVDPCSKTFDPNNNQIDDVKRDESMIDNLDALTKKYNRYQNTSLQQKSNREQNMRYDSRYGKHNEIDNRYQQEREHPIDPYEELIESKNIEIDDLKHEITKLKQKFVDMSITYNSKIDRLRQDHRKELHSQHKKFMERIKTCNQNEQSDEHTQSSDD